MDFGFRSGTVKKIRTRIFSIAFGSSQKIIATSMVIAIVASMGMLGASGNLFQPIPGYSPHANQGTFHVRVTPDAIHVGGSTNITAFVTSYIHFSSIQVNVSVMGPEGSGIITEEYATINTDAHGNGSVTLGFPGLFGGLSSTYAVGTYTVVAAFAQVYTSIYAYSHFVVHENAPSLTPEVFMTPGFGPVGTSVEIHGNHFASNSEISIYYNGTQIPTTPSNIVTTHGGSFQSNFTVPSSSGINTVKVQDQYGNYNTLSFLVGSSKHPGPLSVSSTSSLIVNESGVADFLSTIGMQVVLTGTNPANGTHSDISAAFYSTVPQNITAPNLETPQIYGVKVLSVKGGNATISISSAQVKNDTLNAMQYWTGKDWASAGSVYVSGNMITGVIPVNDLGNTTIAIGHLPPPYRPYGYLGVVVPVVAAAILALIAVGRRRRVQGTATSGTMVVPLDEVPPEDVVITADINNLVRDAYLKGWSERDAAEIFNSTRWRVRTSIRGLDNSQKELHKAKNKDRNKLLNAAVKNYRKGKDKAPPFNEIRREFHRRTLNSARDHYGSVPP